MASTFFGLDIGVTGLFAAQTGLNTTFHNITNIETKGYTRQVVTQKAGTPYSTNSSYGMIGSGVNVEEITQIRSQYFDEKFRSNTALHGRYESRSYYMNEVQSYLNEIELKGFTTTFDGMYDSLQELSKDPANLTVRTELANKAQSLCEYFNSLSTNLSKIQQECNYEVKNQVTRINSLATQVANLTQQINTVELGGQNANDLRDQRANMIDELSKMVNVTVTERPIGDNGMTEYLVRLDGQLLVDNYQTMELQVIPREKKMNQNDIDGLYEIYWKNGERLNAESTSMSGSLKAIFEVRDGNNEENLQGYVEEIDKGATEVTISSTNINNLKDLNIPPEGKITIGNGEYTYTSFKVTTNEDGTYSYTFELEEEARRQYPEGTKVSIGTTIDYKGIPYYHAQLNQFVRVFTQSFNDLHSSGENLNGDTGINFFSAKNTMTAGEYNLNSFGIEKNDEMAEFDSDPLAKEVPYYFLTASNFTVSKAILDDPSMVVAASEITNGVSKADIANKLVALKSDMSMFKQGDPAAFLQTLVGEVGVDTTASLNFAKSQENIVQSVTSQRLSVAGVDIDEEAMNLARYQEAYQLSARVISTMNEIYNTLINDVR